MFGSIFEKNKKFMYVYKIYNVYVYICEYCYSSLPLIILVLFDYWGYKGEG